MFSFPRILSLLGLVLFLSAKGIQAQSIPFSDHIGSEDGLTSQLCQYLTLDSYGNLWIGSFVDVQKYDGYSVKAFPLTKLEDRELPLVDLWADQNGKVWVIQGNNHTQTYENHHHLTYSYHISIIDAATNEVLALKDYLDENVITQDNIKLIQPIEDQLYLITKQNEIYIYKSKLTFYSSHPDKNANIKINRDGHIISIDQNEIRIVDQKGEKNETIDSSAIAQYPIFCISDNGEIYFFKPNQNAFKLIEYRDSEYLDVMTINYEDIKSFLKHYELQSLQIKTFQDDKILVQETFYNSPSSSALSLQSSRGNLAMFDYTESTNGLSFIATNLGVYIFNNKKILFENLASNSAKQNSVRAFFKNKHIRAFKVNEYEETLESISDKYDISFLDNYDFGDLASMHYLDPMNKDILWSCGYLKSPVVKIDFRKRQIKTDFEIKSDIYFTSGIHRSSISGKLYISSSHGLLYFNEKNQSFEDVDLDCFDSNSTEITHIVENKGNLLLASTKGVIVYKEKENQCYIDPIFSDSIKHTIQFIHQDRKEGKTVWLGTRKGGLIKWDITQNTFTKYNTSNGLSNNDVHAILEDKQERLWVSTNRYLNCLDKRTNEISIFTEQDGISHSEFNKYSYFNDTLNNQFYFGGLNGYNHFNPDSINSSSSENNIQLRIIDAIKIGKNAKQENILNSISSSSFTEFQEQDVSLQFILSTNHLYHSKNINYSYRIPGIYEEWKSLSSNVLSLNRLPYGKYTLELVSDITKPAFTSDILSLNIDVIQPFRKTWIAKILATLGFLILLWLAVQQYLKSIKQRNANLEKIVTERTKELSELNQTKNKIFAILAHDLRNPINSLTNIAEKTRFLARHNRLEEIDLLTEQTESRLNSLNDNLNNILLWALSENKMLQLVPEKLSLLLEIRKITSLYATQIEEKCLKIHVDLEDIDQVYVDIKVLQTILRNYLNNAIKFSYDHGVIDIRKHSESSNSIVLVIEDNGIGLHQDKKVAETSRQKKIRDEGKGSGIGLKISKELANQANIKIEIRSHIDHGTSILLDFPKSN